MCSCMSELDLRKVAACEKSPPPPMETTGTVLHAMFGAETYSDRMRQPKSHYADRDAHTEHGRAHTDMSSM